MSYHRIYIAKINEVPFKAEANKSGLVNELLMKYYDSGKLVEFPLYEADRDGKVRKVGTDKAFLPKDVA